MSKKDGGPAFPQISTEIGQQYEPHISSSGGISKLEWFAGKALSGIISGTMAANKQWRAFEYAGKAYEIAEAMLAESERRKS